MTLHPIFLRLLLLFKDIATFHEPRFRGDFSIKQRRDMAESAGPKRLAVFTDGTWNNDDVVAVTTDNHHHQHLGKADEAVIRSYAQRYIGDILRLLGKVPRQMLLLLKTADCLRHLDRALLGPTTRSAAGPTNALFISGKYAAAAVYEDECRRCLAATNQQQGSTAFSWLKRFRIWWRYMGVVIRIRLHETILSLSSPSLLSLKIG